MDSSDYDSSDLERARLGRGEQQSTPAARSQTKDATTQTRGSMMDLL